MLRYVHVGGEWWVWGVMCMRYKCMRESRTCARCKCMRIEGSRSTGTVALL